MPTLPPELLRNLGSRGGRVVLVTGAGTSVEAPTLLPLSREASVDANRRLIADGILDDGECPNPDDLSALADIVFAKMDNRQRELVMRLPRDRFRAAEPNEGHLLAAVLLVESGIGNVLTLNFDLALDHALSFAGNDGRVAVVAGPEDVGDLANSNLIYLHRNVTADPEQWILRSESLNEAWRDHWEEPIAARIMTAPVVVFAGLGTPAAVLVETVAKLRATLGAGVLFFQVDPGPIEGSDFAKILDIDESAYIRLGWIDFMRELANRLLQELQADTEAACRNIAREHGWDEANVNDICNRVSAMGLVEQGRMRARWLMSESAYVTSSEENCRFIADLLLLLSAIEAALGVRGEILSDGTVAFHKDGSIVGRAIMASAIGYRRWGVMETRLGEIVNRLPPGRSKPSVAIVSGAGRPAAVAPPESIMDEGDSNDIIPTRVHLAMLSVDELRGNPSLIEALW